MTMQHGKNSESLLGLLGAYKIPTVIITLGLVLAIVGFQWTLRYDLRQSEKAFFENADQIYQDLSREMHRHGHIIISMSHILGQMDNLTEEEFSNVSEIFSKSTFYSNFYYYRFVSGSANAAIRRGEMQSGNGGIKEYFTSADIREKEQNMTGLPEISRAIEQARRSKQVTASGPYTVQGDQSTKTMIALVAPAADGGDNNLFLVGILDVELFFYKILENTGERYNIRVQGSAADSTKSIYQYLDDEYTQNFSGFNAFDLEFMNYSRDLLLGQNKLWSLQIMPSFQADLHYIGLLPWVTFLSIIAITALLSYIIFRITTENIKAQIQVEKQTRSLRNYATRLEMSNRDLDDFAYVASHDLKEPLRGLRNYAEILEEDYGDQLDEEGRSKLSTLKTLSKRMESLIESLFEYSKISRIDLAIKKTDIRKVVEDTTDLMRIWLKEQNAEIVVVTELPTIECDSVKVGEVFRNLITNGVKYNEEVHKRIEIGCDCAHSSENREPVFWVKDTGIGIAEEHKEFIFKIFKRLHERDGYGGGMGAGLTIVWRIIQRHGGKIWVESRKGEGSIFYFTLKGKSHDNSK